MTHEFERLLFELTYFETNIMTQLTGELNVFIVVRASLWLYNKF